MTTYYLASLDSVRFSAPRRCDFISRLRMDTGKECAVVRLTPPVPLQEHGVLDDLDTFVLLSRHEGQDLFAITRFPVFVFITRLLATHTGDTITKSHLEILGWGELYRSEQDARDHRFDQP